MAEALRFDKEDKDSPFLTFVAKEFHARGSQLRKELADKNIAAKIVSDSGLRVPRKYKVFSRWTHLSLPVLKKRFVLKYAHGWSARGVMLLERTGFNRYFDYMSLKAFSLKELRAHQIEVANSFKGRPHTWIVEEFLEPAQANGAIPFDYKCYVFGQQIGLIIQVDRNSYPPRITFMDGGFQPLEMGKDYILTTKSMQPGVPSVPYFAPEIQWWAMKLASFADAPFVSIDLYDTSAGPVFGEFTFSPGGVHKRMFQFSHSLLAHFDSLFMAAEKHLENQWQGMGDYPQTEVTQYLDKLRALPIRSIKARKSLPLDSYRIYSGIACNDGKRGALRLAESYKLQINHEKPELWFVSSWLSGVWMKIKEGISLSKFEQEKD